MEVGVMGTIWCCLPVCYNNRIHIADTLLYADFQTSQAVPGYLRGIQTNGPRDKWTKINWTM